MSKILDWIRGEFHRPGNYHFVGENKWKTKRNLTKTAKRINILTVEEKVMGQTFYSTLFVWCDNGHQCPQKYSDNICASPQPPSKLLLEFQKKRYHIIYILIFPTLLNEYFGKYSIIRWTEMNLWNWLLQMKSYFGALSFSAYCLHTKLFSQHLKHFELREWV